MDKFDLYWFDYVNQDGTKKTRPVLILEEGIILPIAEVTSHDPRTDKDYKIVKWEEAGLPKPSTIRFDKIQFATSSLLKDNIGHLDQEDIDKIKELKLVESLEETFKVAPQFLVSIDSSDEFEELIYEFEAEDIDFELNFDPDDDPPYYITLHGNNNDTAPSFLGKIRDLVKRTGIKVEQLEESLEDGKIKYHYHGPVYYFHEIISRDFDEWTEAFTSEEALRNLTSKAKKKLGYKQNSNITLNKNYLEFFDPEDESFPEIKKCDKCGTELLDDGTCPKCDRHYEGESLKEDLIDAYYGIMCHSSDARNIEVSPESYKYLKDFDTNNDGIAEVSADSYLSQSKEADEWRERTLEAVNKLINDIETSANKESLDKLFKEVPDALDNLRDIKSKLEKKLDKDLEEDIEKHDTLNTKLFENNKLKPDIREALLKVADTFVEDLKFYEVKFNIKDIILVGSNASYNYTKDSDIDIHIIADREGLECPDNLYPLLYSAYSSIFNKNYDINIKDIPVELYVEFDEPAISNGIYSIKNDEWIKEPVQKEIPDIDYEEFNKEFEKWEDRYLNLINTIKEEYSEEILNFIEDIYELRKEAMDSGNEYALGNLIFKEFRNRGYLDNLKELRKKEKGKELSLESLTEDELYEAKLNETNDYLINKYRELACLDENEVITEDNLEEWALNKISAVENYDVNDLKELLLGVK